MQKQTQILFVEDELIFQQLYGKALEEAGYHVTYASNGEEAVSFLKKHKFDVLISDLIMPLMSGMSFLKQVQGACKRIIVLTALSGETDKQDAINNGVSYFCVKTETSPKELVTYVEMCLQKK